MSCVVRKRSRMLSASAPRRDTIDLEIGWFGLMPLLRGGPAGRGGPRPVAMSGLGCGACWPLKEIVRALAQRQAGPASPACCWGALPIALPAPRGVVRDRNYALATTARLR